MERVLQGLRVAKTALDLVPVSVPGLGPAVELALNIMELVQKAKSAKEECSALALRAAEFSLGIYEQLKRAPDVDMTSSTTEPIAALLCVLKEVEILMKRQAKKRAIVTFWKQDEVEDTITKLKKRLDEAVQLFGVQSAIATRQDLMQISAAQTVLVQRAEDSTRVQDVLLSRTIHIDENMAKVMQHITLSTVTTDEDGTMVLTQGDFQVIDEIDVSVDNMIYDLETTEHYRLRVKKTKETLIIKKYSRQDEDFRNIIQRHKDIALRSRDILPNPHIVDIVAYSSPKLSYGFVAIPGAEEHIPFEEVFQKLHGTDRFLRTLDVAKQLQSAFHYLARDLKLVKEVDERNCGDTFGSRDLYFTPEGTVRWNADVWSSDMLPGMLCMADGYIEFGYKEHQAISEVNLTRLRQLLNSPSAIERAATLFLLWDKLMEFTDFNRTEDNVFWTEDVPPIGSCVHNALTPEGRYVFSNQKTDVFQYHKTACMFAFDEDNTEEEYLNTPHDLYLTQLAYRDRLVDGPARITKSRMTPDGCWRRHTVLDMDYGVGIRTIQQITENDKCRNFFLTQAVNLDLPRYITDVCSGAPLSIAYSLHFITTSHLVSLGPSPTGKPPRRLYFYELRQNSSTMMDFDAPWGYWSTSPKPIRPKDFPWERRERPEDNRWFIKKYKMEVEYCGHGRDFKFVWTQTIAGFVFRIETMVVVQSYRLTMDERLMLRDVQECLTEAYRLNSRVAPTVVRQNVRRKRVEIEREESHYGCAGQSSRQRSKRRRILE